MKPSALLATALANFRQCEIDPRYHIDMEVYHEVWVDTCAVCLGGAYAAKTLGYLPNVELRIDDMPRCDERSLVALDLLRQGQVGAAFLELELEAPIELEYSYPIPHYEDNPDGFKRELHTLVKTMEGAGV